MRIALAALALIVASPAMADDPPVLIGKPGKVKFTFVGCLDKDDAYKFKSLMRDGDKEAAIKFALRKIPDCRAISEGTMGVVQDSSIWQGATCLRPKGEPDCFWLPIGFVVAP